MRKLNLLIIAWFLLYGNMNAQTLFKTLQNSGNSFEQLIAHFPDGDLLIVDSSREALLNEENGQIFISRMDPCGTVEWSYSYLQADGFLELKDVAVNDKGEIFLFGSAHRQAGKLMFLLKLNTQGEEVKFKFLEVDSIDHFAYSMDIQENAILIYGLILDWDTTKYGIVALLDDKLNFRWSQKISGFSLPGKAILTSESEVVCQAGPNVILLDKSGQLAWSKTLNSSTIPSPIGGPFKAKDGFLLQSQQSGNAVIYKIDFSGSLIWKSAQFETSKYPVDMEEQEDGNFLVVYGCPNKNPCKLTLSDVGFILNQQQLNSDYSLDVGTMFLALDNTNKVSISTNQDLFSGFNPDINTTLITLDPNNPESTCFTWESINSTSESASNITLSEYNINLSDFNLPTVDQVQLKLEDQSSPFIDLCNNSLSANYVQLDTTLPCGQNWMAFLPGNDFSWVDNTQENPRMIRASGSYLAKNQSCVNPIVYEYILEKEACTCQLSFPNAFSPNGDGNNDELSFFGNCTVLELEILIFDRWGNLVVQSNNPSFTWDGTFNQQQLGMGIFIVMASYLLEDEKGGQQQGSIYQEVLIVK